MAIVKRVVSRDVFEELKNLPKAQQREKIEPTIPREWVCGRGYYGFYLSENEEDGNCYICFHIGDSCD